MTIRCIYTEQPSFPPTENDPAASRVQIGSLWVDYTGAVPDQGAVDAVFAPSADQVRRTAIRNDARTAAIVNVLTTKDNTGIKSTVAAAYPGLAGDGLKAVQDIALALAYIFHNGG